MAGGGAATNVGAGGDAELAQRRRFADAILRQQKQSVDSAYAAIIPLLMARAQGQESPFGEAGRKSLRADVTDSTGAQARTEHASIDRGFSNAMGSGSSGGSIAAKASADRAAAAAARQGMRDVDTRTRVEDFAAKERGQSALMAAEQAKIAALSDYMRQALGYTSNFEATNSQERLLQAMLGGRPGGAGASMPGLGGGGGMAPQEVAAQAANVTPAGGGYDAGRQALQQQLLASQRAAYYGSLPPGLGDYGSGGTAGRSGAPTQNYGGGYAYPASLGPQKVTGFEQGKSGGLFDNLGRYYPPSNPSGNFVSGGGYDPSWAQQSYPFPLQKPKIKVTPAGE